MQQPGREHDQCSRARSYAMGEACVEAAFDLHLQFRRQHRRHRAARIGKFQFTAQIILLTGHAIVHPVDGRPIGPRMGMLGIAMTCPVNIGPGVEGPAQIGLQQAPLGMPDGGQHVGKLGGEIDQRLPRLTSPAQQVVARLPAAFITVADTGMVGFAIEDSRLQRCTESLGIGMRDADERRREQFRDGQRSSIYDDGSCRSEDRPLVRTEMPSPFDVARRLLPCVAGVQRGRQPLYASGGEKAMQDARRNQTNGCAHFSEMFGLIGISDRCCATLALLGEFCRRMSPGHSLIGKIGGA
eukprot:TRINITY_DN6873_c0_g1_i2.p1 TRINITY_DN6873_c0_g1~~TRINITY_DN6873_c0_g1_i2.p1  ORF type:complete len:298 (-),score=27.84 TRINITY_DN6873_c0_g1_i2:258-1151(-)